MCVCFNNKKERKKLEDLEIGVLGPRLVVVGFGWAGILVGRIPRRFPMDELLHIVDARRRIALRQRGLAIATGQKDL